MNQEIRYAKVTWPDGRIHKATVHQPRVANAVGVMATTAGTFKMDIGDNVWRLISFPTVTAALVYRRRKSALIGRKKKQ